MQPLTQMQAARSISRNHNWNERMYTVNVTTSVNKHTQPHARTENQLPLYGTSRAGTVWKIMRFDLFDKRIGYAI